MAAVDEFVRDTPCDCGGQVVYRFLFPSDPLSGEDWRVILRCEGCNVVRVLTREQMYQGAA